MEVIREVQSESQWDSGGLSLWLEAAGEEDVFAMPAEDRRPDGYSHEGRVPETSTRRLRAQSQREFEIGFFGKILERDPFNTAALRVQGNNLAACGEHTRALQLDRRLVRLQPERPVPWYNLACTYSMLGMIDPAFSALERAIRLGYEPFEHLIRDPDLKALRRDARFNRLLSRF